MDVTGLYNLDTREHNLHSNYERRKRRRSRAGKHLDRLEEEEIFQGFKGSEPFNYDIANLPKDIIN